MNEIFDKVLDEFENTLRISNISFCVIPSSYCVVNYYFNDDDISKVMCLMAGIKMHEYTCIDVVSNYLSIMFKGEYFTGRQIIISSKRTSK